MKCVDIFVDLSEYDYIHNSQLFFFLDCPLQTSFFIIDSKILRNSESNTIIFLCPELDALMSLSFRYNNIKALLFIRKSKVCGQILILRNFGGLITTIQLINSKYVVTITSKTQPTIMMLYILSYKRNTLALFQKKFAFIGRP